jgi:hypothetical protein
MTARVRRHQKRKLAAKLPVCVKKRYGIKTSMRARTTAKMRKIQPFIV